MIEGLHFDVSSEEVGRLLEKRISQCERKAKMYDRQADQQAEMTAELGKEEDDMPKHSGDQATQLRAHAADYRQRIKQYNFLNDHLIAGETYRLDDKDLRFLGVVDKNAFW